MLSLSGTDEFLQDLAHGPTAGTPLGEYEKWVRQEAKTILSHGGRRPGAGRKPKPDKRVMVAIRLPVDLAARLKAEPDQTQLIETLLRNHYAPK